MRRGALLALPVGAGIFAWGIVFGLMAREAGLRALESLVMSALVYSGTGQAATVGALAAGSGVAAAIATLLMLNARYLLYGASLRPWLAQVGAGRAYGTLFFLGDVNWVLAMRAHEEGERDAGFLLGSGAAMYLAWLAGTLLGALSGDGIADPRSLGLDFLLVAFCMAMGAGLLRARSDAWPAAAGVAVAAVLELLAPSGWTVVAAGLAGGAVAAFRFREAA